MDTRTGNTRMIYSNCNSWHIAAANNHNSAQIKPLTRTSPASTEIHIRSWSLSSYDKTSIVQTLHYKHQATVVLKWNINTDMTIVSNISLAATYIYEIIYLVRSWEWNETSMVMIVEERISLEVNSWVLNHFLNLEHYFIRCYGYIWGRLGMGIL